MSLERAALFRLATSLGFERAVKRLPGGEELSWRAASRYVAGRSRPDALATARRLLDNGHGVSVDLFGERVKDTAIADKTVADYMELAASLPPPPADAWLSVDLSHLALGIDPDGAADRLERIAAALTPGRCIQVGAEEASITDAVLDCVLTVAERGLADRLSATVQANLKRTPEDLDRITEAGIHVRLVKGAYVESGTVAHPYGEATDVAFLRLAFELAERGRPFSLATHDARLREAVLLAQGPTPVEQLLGVREDELQALTARGVPTRVYIPYGADWFRYWLRRVAESRGA